MGQVLGYVGKVGRKESKGGGGERATGKGGGEVHGGTGQGSKGGGKARDDPCLVTIRLMD